MTHDPLNPNWQDKFLGCLVGLAIGDALGSPTEYKTRADIADLYGAPLRDYQSRDNLVLVAGHKEVLLPPHPAGFTTEDTELALTQAESLVRTGGTVEPLDAGHFLTTLLDGPLVEFLGTTTFESLTRARQDGNYQNGGTGERSAGNAVAVRLVPLGLLHSYGRFDRPRFWQDCQRAAWITHRNPVAVGAGIAVAQAVRVLCRGEIIPEDLMAAALDILPPGPTLNLPMAGNPLHQKLLAAQDFIEERQTLVDNVEAGDLSVDFFRIDLNNMERCGLTSYAPDTLAAAFYAFVARKDSFEEAVTLAVNAGGDSDTIAAITGALAGAFHGLSAIPPRWVAGLLNVERVSQIAFDLHKTARSRELTDYINTGI